MKDHVPLVIGILIAVGVLSFLSDSPAIKAAITGVFKKLFGRSERSESDLVEAAKQARRVIDQATEEVQAKLQDLREQASKIAEIRKGLAQVTEDKPS